MDQKPSLFNNTGHLGTYAEKGKQAGRVWENFAQMRQRYTILTSVDSSSTFSPSEGGDPPHVFILFKGKKGGKIDNDMQDLDLPSWMHIQVQENGSYREDDVVDALRIWLPECTDSTQSKIVMLDWFAAHRTTKVISFIEQRGHIVLFHGGGCTPFTQVNDTHLHALLARLLIRLENNVMHGVREHMWMNHQAGVPSLRREDIVDIVKTAWPMLEHGSIAQKGYAQTGPGMALDGPIKYDDVYKGFRPVWMEMDPPVELQQMGQTIRDEAKVFVEEGFRKKKWTNWRHAKRLIIEHDDEDDPFVEGMELAELDITRGDSDEDDDDDPEVDLHHDGRERDEVIHVDDDAEGDDGAPGEGDDGALGDHVVVADSSDDLEKQEAHALGVLIDKCRRDQNDSLLRTLLAIRDANIKRAKETGQEAAVILQRAQSEELAKRLQLRREAKEVKRREREEDEVQRTERKMKAAVEAEAMKLARLKAEARKQQEEFAARERAEKKKQYETWLQHVYPSTLAESLITLFEGEERKQRFTRRMRHAFQKDVFRFPRHVSNLWDENKNDLIVYGHAKFVNERSGQAVRCSGSFKNFLVTALPKTAKGVDGDPVAALRTILDVTIPGCTRYLLTRDQEFQEILRTQHWILEKAFVHCVILVTRYMVAEGGWSQGVYEWPPLMPAADKAEAEAVSWSSASGAAASSSATVSPPVAVASSHHQN